MNWIDIVVIAVIVGLGVIGLKKGLVYSLFKFASFFISAILAIKLYPVVAKVLSEQNCLPGLRRQFLKGSCFSSKLRCPV